MKATLTTVRGAALCAAAAALLAAGAATPSHAAEPVAQVASSCSLAGSYGKLGPTYAYQLKVTRTSCATGKKVIRALHNCTGGRRGHCHHRVLGYACSEKRSYGVSQFDSSVHCSRGSRHVSYVYSQNF
jgi:hypothetical protein